MKAVAFHASLSATWVDANGFKWEYEFWFGKDTMNPAVEIALYYPRVGIPRDPQGS